MIRFRCRLPVAYPPDLFFPSYSDRNPRSSSYVSLLPTELRSPIPLSLRFDILRCRHWSRRPLLQCCKVSTGNGDRDPSRDSDDSINQFVEAVLLVSETTRHFKMWKQGFAKESNRNLPDQDYPFPYQANGPKSNVRPIDHDFLCRFQSPTIFLKIVCDVDLLLPIMVGDFTVSRLVDDLVDDQREECSDLFQCSKDIVASFGYEVKMVCITKRVVNTYYARIFLGKPVERATLNVDARPSDALIVAKRFKAPILVSKEIVLNDAIKIVHGTWSRRSSKSVYNVDLDSAPEKPDPISKELDFIKKMDIAVMEERYEEAAMWRDTLFKLRAPRTDL